MNGPIETKVTAASIGAALSSFVLWALNQYVFHADVPPEVVGLVVVAVPGAVSFAAGYLARHTARPDLPGGAHPTA